MNDQLKITIDGKDYAVESLSQDALNQLSSINVVDRKIADLSQDMAILQTARNAYAAALPKN
jgi:cell division protein ZapA (FtsZ GTPase activity inhibitor)